MGKTAGQTRRKGTHTKLRGYGADRIQAAFYKRDFDVPVTFDPDAVFGTNVATDANDDYLNVYADFDLDVGEVCDALTVIQVCGDGSEETYRYPLTEEDRSILRSKMNDYCMEQTGMSLDDYRAQYLDEEMCASSFPDGQSM